MSAKKWAVLGSILIVVSIVLPLVLYNTQASSNAFFNQLAERTFVSGAWSPSGDYALLVGLGGCIYRFDGERFVDLTSGAPRGVDWHDISWKPDGTAFITGITTAQGSQLVALGFDGQSFTEEPSSGWSTAFPVSSAWAPNGSYALVLASNSYAKFYGNSFSTFTNTSGFYCRSASWKPDGSYALVTGEASLVLKFDGKSFTRIPIATGAQYLWASWMPDGSSAVIYGLVPRYTHISSETGIENSGGGFVWKYDGDHLAQLTPLVSAGPSLWPYLGAAMIGAVIGLSVILAAVRKRKPATKDSEPHDATPVAYDKV